MDMDKAVPTILIADDDPDLRQLVRLNLEPLACRILEARDGEHTIEQIVVERPDLVVLDVMMPRVSGWEILRYIRKHEDSELASTGVLMLTGIGATLTELSSHMYAADDYLNKPFKAHELLEKVQRILAQKSRLNEAQR